MLGLVHRITEWWKCLGWKRPLEITLKSPPLCKWAGSQLDQHFQSFVQAWPWLLSGMGHLQPLWAVQCFTTLIMRSFFLISNLNLSFRLKLIALVLSVQDLLKSVFIFSYKPPIMKEEEEKTLAWGSLQLCLHMTLLFPSHYFSLHHILIFSFLVFTAIAGLPHLSIPTVDEPWQDWAASTQ